MINTSFNKLIIAIKHDWEGYPLSSNSSVSIKNPWKTIYDTTPIHNLGKQVYQYPILNYSNLVVLNILKSHPYVKIFNPVYAKSRVNSKSNFYKNAGKITRNFLPKYETNPHNVLKSLKFPIIAKLDDGHSGLGIIKIDTPKKFNQINHNRFDLYMEQIDILKEYRIYVWKGTPLITLERINIGKTLDKKSTNEKLEFVYLLRYHKILEDYSSKKENNYIDDDLVYLHSLTKDVALEIPELDFFAIDLATDKSGRMYIFEINSEPGNVYNSLFTLYNYMYFDVYGMKMDLFSEKYLKDKIIEDIMYRDQEDRKILGI